MTNGQWPMTDGRWPMADDQSSMKKLRFGHRSSVIGHSSRYLLSDRWISEHEGPTRMIRLGICNELFEGWEFAQFCRTVKAIGYDGLEIAPFTLAQRITDVSPARRRELRAMVEDAGLATI